MSALLDRTGNRKRRAPMCPVTRAMADAGKAKLDTLTSLDDGVGVTDEQIVSEIFHAMWGVYWEQVFALQGKNLKAPSLVQIPPTGLLRN